MRILVVLLVIAFLALAASMWYGWEHDWYRERRGRGLFHVQFLATMLTLGAAMLASHVGNSKARL